MTLCWSQERQKMNLKQTSYIKKMVPCQRQAQKQNWAAEDIKCRKSEPGRFTLLKRQIEAKSVSGRKLKTTEWASKKVRSLLNTR